MISFGAFAIVTLLARTTFILIEKNIFGLLICDCLFVASLRLRAAHCWGVHNVVSPLLRCSQSIGENKPEA